jgi:arylformamidase
LASTAAEFAEREYNLRRAFPDHAQWFARWAADSAAARSALASHLDVRYGAGPKQTLDVFPAAYSRSTLLFIHGGFWRALDKSDQSFVAPALVASGIGVAVINYDLCPHVSIGHIVDECAQAVEWLQREGTRYGLATQRVAVAGHSAGGHLCAMLFAADWPGRGLANHSIVAGIAISGVFDLAPLVDVSFNADLRLDAKTACELSPAYLPARVHAPLLLAVGSGETPEFIRQSQLQWERWKDRRPATASGPMLIADRHHYSVLSELANPDSALATAAIHLIEHA